MLATPADMKKFPFLLMHTRGLLGNEVTCNDGMSAGFDFLTPGNMIFYKLREQPFDMGALRATFDGNSIDLNTPMNREGVFEITIQPKLTKLKVSAGEYCFCSVL